MLPNSFWKASITQMVKLKKKNRRKEKGKKEDPRSLSLKWKSSFLNRIQNLFEAIVLHKFSWPSKLQRICSPFFWIMEIPGVGCIMLNKSAIEKVHNIKLSTSYIVFAQLWCWKEKQSFIINPSISSHFCLCSVL